MLVKAFLEETETLQTKIINKLRTIKRRDKLTNGLIDWDKIEFECTDNLYLKSKKDLKAIEDFNKSNIVKIFESKNRAILNKLSK